MKLAVQHPAGMEPDVGRVRREPFRTGGEWYAESIIEEVIAFYPDDGELVVVRDEGYVSWPLGSAEVVEGAVDDRELLFGEPDADESEESPSSIGAGTAE